MQKSTQDTIKTGELVWVAFLSLTGGFAFTLSAMYCCKYIKKNRKRQRRNAMQNDDSIDFLPDLACKRTANRKNKVQCSIFCSLIVTRNVFRPSQSELVTLLWFRVKNR